MLTVANADAQRADHLRCRRVETGSAAPASVDLQSRLGVDADCKIQFAARELCESAHDEEEARAAAATPEVRPVSIERLCYRVRCPRRAAREITVSDRFGDRSLSLRTPSLLCLAAP
jgi:hypothetical protein